MGALRADRRRAGCRRATSPSPTPASGYSSARRCSKFQAVQHSSGGDGRGDRTGPRRNGVGDRRCGRLRLRQRRDRLRGDGGEGRGGPRRRSGDHHRAPVARRHRRDRRAPAVAGHDAGTQLGRRVRHAPRTTRGGWAAWRWPPTTRGTSSSAVQHLVDARLDLGPSPRPARSMPNRSVNASSTSAAVSKRICSVFPASVDGQMTATHVPAGVVGHQCCRQACDEERVGMR